MPEIYRSAVPATMKLRREFSLKELSSIVTAWIAENQIAELGYEKVGTHMRAVGLEDGYEVEPHEVAFIVEESYILND